MTLFVKFKAIRLDIIFGAKTFYKISVALGVTLNQLIEQHKD